MDVLIEINLQFTDCLRDSQEEARLERWTGVGVSRQEGSFHHVAHVHAASPPDHCKHFLEAVIMTSNANQPGGKVRPLES